MLKCDLKSCFEHWPPQLKLRISYLLVILFRNAWNEWSTFSTIVNAGLLLGKENFDKCSHLAACSRRLSCPASRGLPRSPWALLPHHIPGWWPCCCCEGRLPKDNCKKKQSVSDYVVTTELLTSGKQRFALTVLWSYWQQCAPPPACAPETCSHATGRWGPGWCSAAPWRLLSAGYCSDRRPPADGPLPPPPHAHSTDANHLRQRGQMNGSERDGQVIWRCLKQRS